MVSIIELLPLLEGWRYAIREHEYVTKPIRLRPGERHVAYDEEGMGWVLSGAGIFSNKHARLVIEYDDARIDFSPHELYSAGLTAPNPGIILYAPRYDEENDYYVICFNPPYGLGYRARLRIYLYNPERVPVTNEPNSDCLLYYYFIPRVEVVDAEAFRRSLARVLGAQAVVAQLGR